MNVMMLAEMAAQMSPDRVAFGSRAGGVTYQELFDRAGAAARRLQESGCGTVAFVGVGTPAFPVTVFAAAWAGVPLAPLNYRLGDEQLGPLLDRLDAPHVVADGEFVDRLAGLGHDAESADQWMASADGDPAGAWEMDPDGVALLLYTSGTTATPKAAVLRHQHLTSYVLGSVEFGSAGEADAALVSVPPYHIAGVSNVLSNVYAGRRVVQLPQFTPEAWLGTAREEEVTHALVVPTMLARVVEHLGDAPSADVPTLRSLAYGGAPMPVRVLERALRLFDDTDFVNAYGLTETSSTIALLGPDDHRQALASDDPVVRARLGSAGRILPTVEAQVRDEGGSPVPPGESGLLWVRGEQVSGEYAGDGTACDAEGWFPTGDIARVDGDGFLYVSGRADDTIIRGGENIAPAEIEDVLREHDSVADVAVVGPADDEWGQRIAAVVVPVVGAEVDEGLLEGWCRDRLRGSKTPDQIEIRPELPYTDTGKLLRRQLKAELEA